MSVTDENSQGVSFSIATFQANGAVVMGFAEKFIFFHYDKPEETFVVDDGQIVRSVAVSQLTENGPLYVVTGGDGKRINVYNASTKNSLPVFSFGPHTKRITHVEIGDDATILFVDKFGEVYRLELSGDMLHASSSASTIAVKPIFLLQHFSVLTNCFMSSRVYDSTTETLKQWLITCDRDRHTRVSCYPETYRIEQFLWTNAPQSVVTCITEIPMEDETCLCLLIGCHDGTVHLWLADPRAAASSSSSSPSSSPASSSSPAPFTRTDSHFAADGARGPVAAIARATGGAVVAHAAARALTFLSVCGRPPRFGAAPLEAALEAPPVALAAARAGEALLLERSGRLAAVRPGDGKLRVVPWPRGAVRAAVDEAIARAAEGGAALGTMDLFAAWNHAAVDPRSRVRDRKETGMSEEESGGEEEGEEADGENPKRGEKKGEGEGKKHRMEPVGDSDAL